MTATLIDRLATSPALVLDGAMGTELGGRGVATTLPAWSSHALVVDPETVLAIHRDYVRAGADLLTTNTFRTTRRALSRVGLGDRASELTELAVRLARRAAAEREGDVTHVLGSIAPLEDCFSPELVPEAGTLAREHSEHAATLAGAGVDALLVETMGTRREALAAVRGARATGLPVLASFVASPSGHLLDGDALAPAVSALVGEGINALLINCTPITTTDRVLPKVLALAGSTPVGVYANIGFPHPGQSREVVEAVAPTDYARHAISWMRAGARILGGCCGTTPAHIAAVRQAVDAALAAGGSWASPG